MASFSATDAALVGFGMARNHPKAVLAWAILNLVSTLLIVVAMVSLSGPALMQIQALGADASSADPASMMALYGKVLPGFLLILPISLFFTGVIYAAASRMVLRPADGGPGWLKFGGDEVRQMLVLVLIWIILIAAYLGIALAAGVLIAIGSIGGMGAASLVGILVVLAALTALTFLAVRLSLASPITFATGRMGISESWRMTGPHFWPLLGTFVLAVIMALIVSILAAAIFVGVGSLIFGFKDTMATVTSPDMTSLATVFKPVGLIYYVFSAFVSALTSMIILGPAPTVYAALTGRGADAVFE